MCSEARLLRLEPLEDRRLLAAGAWGLSLDAEGRAIADIALCDTFEETGDVPAPSLGSLAAITELGNHVPVTGLSGVAGSEQFFRLAVPEGARDLKLEISGGTGDADLYVKFGAQPTISDWDYRPYLIGNNETVSVADPAAGDWYVMVRSYSGFSGVTLEGSYMPLLRNNIPATNLSGAAGSEQFFRLSLPAGASSLTIQTSGGTGDCDLYVRRGALPTITAYDYRPYLIGNNETVAVASPPAGEWYVMVRGYQSYAAVTLEASYTPPVASVVMDFGAEGTWLWTAPTAWQFLHAGNPTAMTAGDFDGNGYEDVAISLGGGGGTWIRYDDGDWEFLHPTNATSMTSGDMNADGRSELLVGFASGAGTWQYTPATRAWRYLHPLTPATMACGDFDGNGRADVVMALPAGNGSWIWKNEGTWQYLHGLSASILRAGDFNGDSRAEIAMGLPAPNGLWTWAEGGLWTFVHSWTPNALAVGDVTADGRDDLIVGLGASGGTWEYYPWTRGWKYLHASGTASMTAGDVDANGLADVVVGFANNKGSWVYENNATWQYLHAKSPEAMLAIQIDGTKGVSSSPGITRDSDASFEAAPGADDARPASEHSLLLAFPEYPFTGAAFENTIYTNQNGDASLTGKDLAAGDYDGYQVFWDAAGSTTVATTGSTDTELAYYDGAGAYDAWSDNISPTNLNARLTVGTSYFDVGFCVGPHGSATGPYGLTVNGPAPATYNVPLDANHHGTNSAHDIASQWDADFFWFTTDVAGNWTVTISSPTNADLTLLVFDSAGIPVGGTFTAPIDLHAAAPEKWIGEDLAAGATYYVRVDGFGAATGAYTVDVRGAWPAFPTYPFSHLEGELFVNQNGDATVAGYLVAGRVGRYQVSWHNAGPAAMETTGPLDTVLAFYDGPGDPDVIDDDGSTSDWAAAKITAPVAGSAVCALAVSGISPSTAGSYGLTVNGPAYVGESAITLDAHNFGTGSGSVTSDGDYTMHRFTTSVAGDWRVTVAPAGDWDVVLLVYDGAGNPIDCSFNYPIQRFGIGHNEVWTGTGLTAAATYYIRVDGYGSYAGSYTVDVQGPTRDDLVLDFGADGAWSWKNGGVWQFVHPGNPTAMAAGDFDGNGQQDLALSFGGGGGTWIRYADGHWQFLHPSSATTMTSGDVNADNRSELVIGFAAGGGTWECAPVPGAWRCLHRLTATAMACGDFDGDGRADVAMALPSGSGSWLWKNDSDWQFLHPLSATALQAGNFTGDRRPELVVSLPAPNGLWTWADGGAWAFVHPSTPNALGRGDINADGFQEVIMSFGAAGGTWEYYPSTRAWTFLHSSGAVSMTTGDVDANGQADVVLGLANNKGSWVYKNNATWQYLHAKSPEAMLAVQIDGTKGGSSSPEASDESPRASLTDVSKTPNFSDLRSALAHDWALRHAAWISDDTSQDGDAGGAREDEAHR